MMKTAKQMQYIWNVNNPVLEVDKTSLYNIALEICIQNNVSIAGVRSQNQKQEIVRVRRIIAKEATDFGFKPEEIANVIKKSRTTIYNYLY